VPSANGKATMMTLKRATKNWLGGIPDRGLFSECQDAFLEEIVAVPCGRVGKRY